MFILLKSVLNIVFALLRGSILRKKKCSFSQSITLHSPWSEDNWLTLRAFFRSEGYILWNKTSPTLFQPPSNVPRESDGFAYDDPLGAVGKHYFTSGLSKHWPARTPDCQDVLIVQLSGSEIEILSNVAMDKGSFDTNHSLPLLWVIHHECFTFGVFPLVGLDFTYPWFANMGQTLEAIRQILEGVAFLHGILIAHRDLFIRNILPSRRISACENPDFHRTRYYIIDFEHAVRFPDDSDPATRTVIGPPVPWTHYGRPSPPEMQRETPYCPFKADIWQVGGCLYQLVKDAEPYISGIVELLRTTIADEPENRPTAREILTAFLELRMDVPCAVEKMRFNPSSVEHAKMSMSANI